MDDKIPGVTIHEGTRYGGTAQRFDVAEITPGEGSLRKRKVKFVPLDQLAKPKTSPREKMFDLRRIVWKNRQVAEYYFLDCPKASDIIKGVLLAGGTPPTRRFTGNFFLS